MQTGAGWNRDTWVGLAGAIVLLAAMSGVFLYERGQFQAYDVSWELEEVYSATSDGSLEASGSETVGYTVEDPGTGRLRVALTWTDDVGAADRFRVEVQGPAGQVAQGEGSAGEVSLDLDVSDAPAPTTAAGRSAEDARQTVRTAASSTQGVGTWNVTVTLLEAPGEQLPAGDVESQADGANAYTLAIAHDVWTASVVESS